MPEPLPSSPPSSPPVSAAAPPSPGVARAFAAVLSRPAAFYASLRGQSGVGAPVVFALAMGVASGVVSAALAALGAVPASAGNLVALLAAPVSAVVGCVLGGVLVHLVAAFADGKGRFEDSVRVAGYAAAVMPVGALFGAVPLLGTLVSLYALYVVAQGIVTLHLADRRRTFAACGAVAVLVATLGLLAHFLSEGSRDGAADVDGRFGEGSEFQREMRRAEQELRRAADEAKARQESGR